MLTIEKNVTASPEQYEIIIEGMRNPMNSWDRMDSGHMLLAELDERHEYYGANLNYHIGPDDKALMTKLNNGGAVHAKYRRMLPVWVTINAPLYWWKEFDTYKVGTVCNACSTMHKIHAKEFTLDDFSYEHLITKKAMDILKETLESLNAFRDIYLNGGTLYDDNWRPLCFEPQDKDIWWQMIQLLPSSYNQKRTVMLNYEVLTNIYKSRKNHKLDEWRLFCKWIETLPYSSLIIE